MHINKILIFGLIIILKLDSYGQKDWIIQLKDHTSLNDLETGWVKTNFRKNVFSGVQLISPHFNIVRIKSSENLSASTILQNPYVLYVEPNSTLEPRSLPNDSLVKQQWHLDNISAPLAWNRITGGLTFNNDTIVMGVIDLGFLTTHEDLKNRIWQNRAEIPGNGIDDDANGYTDDVYGLSLRYLNERHSVDNEKDRLRNHGTSVAGLMAGEANNRKGISGINWNVKLMLGTFSENQFTSDLIELFNYMLDQRIRYNRSNGKQGALVVTINYSGGIDFAKANDYPIWCSMYNKMGEEGILNCGATSNKYVDVDEEGDMPSTCPSDYLIAVTNTDINNKKVYSAGFGSKNIDLGAPGENVLSTHSGSNTSYSFLPGTSASSPIVAGAVGLIYSYPCQKWADFIKSNPKEAALKVKQFILSSVDKNPDLLSKTVSGGRLNIANAMDTLANNFCYNGLNTKAFIKTIFPNPVSNYVNIQIDSSQAGFYDLELVDGLGRIIMRLQEVFIKQVYPLYLPVLNNGFYILRLSDRRKQESKKIVIIH